MFNTTSRSALVFAKRLLAAICFSVYMGQHSTALQTTSETTPASATSKIIMATSNQSDLERVVGRLDTWNRAYLIFGVLAVIFTFATVICSAFIYKSSKKVSDLQTTISSEKDRHLKKYQTDAGVQIAQANEKATNANQIAADAVLQAAEVQKQSAALQKEAALLQAANLRLEQQLAPRTLTPDQADFLVSALAPYKGQPVRFVSSMGDVDGLQYRNQFMEVFKKAGWIFAPKDCSQAGFVVPHFGVQVYISPKDHSATQMLASAYVLVTTLYNLKIITTKALNGDPEIPEGTITFLVGEKEPLR